MNATQPATPPSVQANARVAPDAPAVAVDRTRLADDKVLLRAAVDLTRDLHTAKPGIYWPDMLGSAFIGYAALAGAILTDKTWLAILLGLVAVQALYRALLFIHEISHMHRDALPGFRSVWNLLVGIPMLTPSFMYEDGHTIHHSRNKYGTPEDPEYLPLALMKPWSLPVFLLIALLAPPALMVRFGILAPLGLIFPAIRKMNWERFSTLAINPDYRRRPPAESKRRWYILLETGASIWALALFASIPLLGWRPLLVALAVFSVVAVLNQLRTLVAHLWENEGEPMTVTAQYLDSVNVPPPGIVAAMWAPVGLRFHALHHLLPSMPYHSLGEAHRRLSAHLGADSTYLQANYTGMIPLVGRIAASTMRARNSDKAA
ncbi:MAG: fatty acid desaturase family protein [Tsuneonella suprasediminis]|nr:fatty acid desaturase [Altererythrobacter sp. N1]